MREIPNYHGYYATKDGRIWSEPRGRGNKNGRFLKPSLRCGYERVILYVNGKRHNCSVHRLILETFTGSCPKGTECRHLDGSRSNNHIKNLCWGTRIVNQHDRIKHSTNVWAKGEQHGRSKLTEQNVKRIINAYQTKKFTQTAIAKTYGITQSNVSDIINKKSWKHLWENKNE